MTEEQKRIRYRNIVYRLWIINNKIEQLNNSIFFFIFKSFQVSFFLIGTDIQVP